MAHVIDAGMEVALWITYCRTRKTPRPRAGGGIASDPKYFAHVRNMLDCSASHNSNHTSKKGQGYSKKEGAQNGHVVRQRALSQSYLCQKPHSADRSVVV